MSSSVMAAGGRDRTMLVILVISIAIFQSGCGENAAKTAPSPGLPAEVVKQAPPPIQFRDIASESGIDFVHVSGSVPMKLNPTSNGSGAAIFDADGDGIMDLYLVTTNFLPGTSSAKKARNRFYRGLGRGKFVDETEKTGLGFEGHCFGVTAGDIDNDGDADVILFNYGPNRVLLNDGKGVFRDVSEASGLARPTCFGSESPNWSSGGALLDYDNDGDLDLYVANYADWEYTRDKDKYCGHPDKNVRMICGPKYLRTTRHDLWRNEGLKNGVPSFTDATNSAGIARTDGHGFAAVAADLNGDGRIDLNVANDQCPAFTFLNNGDGTFRDATESSGAAFDDKGQALSGMGVDAEDLDGDGLPELLRSHFSKEYNTIHQNLGDGQFSDRTPGYGMNMDSMPWVGWGCVLTDFDNDGWPDSFVTNGHTDDNYHLIGRLDEPYEQPPLLHLNVPKSKGRKFLMVNSTAGPFFNTRHVGRGVAEGDLDDDGRIDLVVNHMDGPPAVLHNETENGNHWIRLRLRGTKTNRDAIGAKIEVIADGKTITRQKKGGVSLASSHDPRVLIGIGPASEASRVVVHWPSGSADSVLTGVKAGTTVDVIEGSR